MKVNAQNKFGFKNLFIIIGLFFIFVNQSKSVTEYTLKDNTIIYGVKKFEFSDTLEIVDINFQKRNLNYYEVKSAKEVKFKFELYNGQIINGYIIDISPKDSIYKINEYILDSRLKDNITDTVKTYTIHYGNIIKMSVYEMEKKTLGIGAYFGFPTYINALIHYKPIRRFGIKATGSYNDFIHPNNGYQIGTFYSVVEKEKAELNLGLLKGYYFDQVEGDPSKSVHYLAAFLDLNIENFYLNIGYQLQTSMPVQSDAKYILNIGFIHYF